MTKKERDTSFRYDDLKEPATGHALDEIMNELDNGYAWGGPYNFDQNTWHQIRWFNDNLPESYKEISPETGEPMNRVEYEDIKEHVPSWEDVKLRHESLLQEYKDYQSIRQRRYPRIEEQLDMLYKDIDSGKLGESAKLSEFYRTIKTVKTNN